MRGQQAANHFTLAFCTALTLGVLTLGSGALAAQEHHHAGGGEALSPGHLGQVHFPTSCAPAVQPEFEKGVALLHSFQYAAADMDFKAVAAQDPSCAIAYWGQSLTLWHALWEHPDAASLKTGHDELQKAKGARTPREREYIAAASAFYDDNPPLDYKARTTAYSEAMAKVYSHYPDDGEAAAFYALSLISIPAEGDADLANRTRAIAILNKLFAAEPDHPGAAHYLIHACDTPALASQGLDAARRYARIAPDSSHALHMPSHIFARLGLWPEMIDSNLAAITAAAQATKAGLGDEHYQIHAMTFLQYAYLQTGQTDKALQLVDALKEVPGISAAEIEDNQAGFRARYALETHDWKMAAGLQSTSTWPVTWWARAIGAARTGDAAAAQAAVTKLDEATNATKSKDSSASNAFMKNQQGYGGSDEKTINQLEADAWLAYAGGKPDDAVQTLRAAADREDREGVDSISIPAREMLGDLLMEMKQPDAALEAYRNALKESPNRLDSRQGATLAARLAGAPATAGGSK
jgi:tetratricopeptide (TPR) repeat protein